MRVAKLHIAVIEFECPWCDEYISSSTGSHMFVIGEPLPEKFICDCCQFESKVPANAKKLWGQK